MHRCQGPVAFVVLWLALGTPVWSGISGSPESACLQWAEIAAHEFDVPVALMKAITTVESGRMQNGQALPWPWTINSGGKGYWFSNRADAYERVMKVARSGSLNIDVGCFQLNLKWHGEHFRSIDDMLEPPNNARYAARFLRQLYQELGSWSSAATAFHSRTPGYAESYRQRLEPVLAGFGGGFDFEMGGSEADAFLSGRAPPIPHSASSVAPRALASLVPLDFRNGADPLPGLRQ